MKRKKIIPVVIVSLLVAFTYLYINNHENKESITIRESTATPNKGGVVPVIEIEEARKIPVEKEFPFSMTELDVQIAIHAMSHQKIRAHNDDKWDLLLMTPERIERLIVVVEANNVKYRKNLDTYLGILNRWKSNDFSSVDEDHNLIWELQNGTKGRAIGIFSPKEEIEFIKEHYNVEIIEVTTD